MFGLNRPIDFGPSPDLGPQIAMPQAAPKKKTGMFGSGGVSIDLSRALAGYLAGIGNPAGIQALQSMNADRQRQLAAAQQQELASQQRENDFQDFVRREAYKAANPGAVNNDTANDYRFIAEKLGPDAANNWLRNQGDPLVTVNLPGNRVYSGPRSQLGSALGAPAPQIQPGHIEDGFRFKGGNPGDPNAWEQVNGGPTPPASGGFPPIGY